MPARLNVTLPPELAARVRPWAEEARLNPAEAVVQLVEHALDDLDDIAASVAADELEVAGEAGIVEAHGKGGGTIDDRPRGLFVSEAARDAGGPLGPVAPRRARLNAAGDIEVDGGTPEELARLAEELNRGGLDLVPRYDERLGRTVARKSGTPAELTRQGDDPPAGGGAAA